MSPPIPPPAAPRAGKAKRKDDQEQGWAKPQKERRPGTAASSIGSALIWTVINQKRLQTGIYEGGQGGREVTRCSGRVATQRAARARLFGRAFGAALFSSAGGYVTGFTKRPVRVSPRL